MGQSKRRTPAIPSRDQREPFAGFHRFPYFQVATPAAASPVIGYRYGRGILSDPAPSLFQFPHFIPFTSTADLATNPVIPIRSRHLVELEVAHLFVRPQYQRFPYFEQPANPPIYYRYGHDVLVGVEAFVPPQYQRFPYVSIEPPPSGLVYTELEII